MDALIAHLQMIQGVINRLSQNSFLLKGWSVVLVSSLFALGAWNTNPLFAYLAYFPVITFWGLDAYFLRQERLFRALYDRVRQQDTRQVDFSMNTEPISGQVETLDQVAFSSTLLGFHGVLLGTVIVIMVVLLTTHSGR